MGVPYGRRVADCSLGEVCRPPLSFVSGPPIQHTACDSQWPAKCASRRSPPLSLAPHRRAAPFLYPRFARPTNRVVDLETGAIFWKKKERNGKEEEKKRRRKGKEGRERERERGKVVATRFAKPRAQTERKRSEVWLCIGRQICADDYCLASRVSVASLGFRHDLSMKAALRCVLTILRALTSGRWTLDAEMTHDSYVKRISLVDVACVRTIFIIRDASKRTEQC